MDRLDAMEVLLAVVDAGTFSAASRKLGLPLPSVSRKVADLEKFLGTRLLIRTSRSVQPTDSGREFVHAARTIVEQIREAEARAAGEYDAPRGALTVTMPLAFGRQYVLPLAYDFMRDYPEITLDLLSLDRAVHLVEEHVDVGIRLGHLTDNSLSAVKVGDFRLLTCASPDYLARKGRPADPEDLVHHDAAVFSVTEETAWVFERDGRKRRGAPNIRVRANNYPAAVAAAVRGIGVTRAPDYEVSTLLQTGALVRILEDHDDRTFPVHLIYIRQGPPPLKVRTFLDWMAPRLRQALRDLNSLSPAQTA